MNKKIKKPESLTIYPPCNVGDLFFMIYSYHTHHNGPLHYEVQPARVTEWTYYSHGSFLIMAESINDYCVSQYIKIGETAFYTCEEAEKELLRLRKQESEKKEDEE